ncbi:MAG: FHA domain-containing protein [Anaerolineaceae bacterium]|nr:FHA domain-containing protein [Anaerolineaceae bacterium]
MNQRMIVNTCLLVLTLCLGITKAVQAQSATPTQLTVNPPVVVPTIEIDSVTYDPSHNAFRVNLIYTNQSFIGGIRVKVENRRTNTLVLSNNYAVVTAFEVNADQLEPGESYILTVTALEVNGQIMRLMIPQSYGNAEPTVIEVIRQFEYEAAPPMLMAISRVSYDEELNSYNITVMLENAEDARTYDVWLRGPGGLRISDVFSFHSPLISPLSISLKDVPQGQHMIVIEALNSQGETIALANSENMTYNPPVCGPICLISNNGILFISVVVVVLILLVLLGFSLFRPHQEKYNLEPRYQPQGHLIDDQDAQRYRRDHLSMGNTTRLYLIPTIQPAQNTLVDKGLFRIGSARDNDLQLEHPEVSGHHAFITVKHGKYYLQDDNSTNGTKLNGVRIETGKLVELQNGNIINFAKFGYQVAIQ